MKCTFEDYVGNTWNKATCTEAAIAEVQIKGGVAWFGACASHLFLASGQGYGLMRPLPLFVNINDEVRVALTREGASYVHSVRPSHPEDVTVLTTELWDAMQLLGPKMHMGGPQMVVGNLIEVKR